MLTIHCFACGEPIAMTESTMPLPSFYCMECGTDEVLAAGSSKGTGGDD